MVPPASLFVLGSFVVACSATVEHLPRPGESLQAGSFTMEPGGKGFNVAVGASRLGGWVDGLFAVGRDALGDWAADAFARAGLPPGLLTRLDAPTGAGIGFTDAAGENCLAVHAGANARLCARDVRAVAPRLRRAGLVAAPFEIGDEPIAEAFAIARAAGRLTLLNPSPYRAIDPAILRNTAILVVNRVEAGCMAGSDDPAAIAPWAEGLVSSGPELVVVTLGAEGCEAYRRGAPRERRYAWPVQVVDTLGAGDAFAAGFAVSLLQDLPLSACLDRASACGAMVCRGPGVLTHLPRGDELEAFLRSAAVPTA